MKTETLVYLLLAAHVSVALIALLLVWWEWRDRQ